MTVEAGARLTRSVRSRALIRMWQFPDLRLRWQSVSTCRDSRSRHPLHGPYEPDVLSCLVGSGGDDGNRTHDPLLQSRCSSQLSYVP